MTAKYIADGWIERIKKSGDTTISLESVKPSPLLEKLVAEGKYGLKSGEGIFKYK